MSKDKITVYAEIKPRGDWQTEGQLESNFEFVEVTKDEKTIHIRRREDKTGLIQRTADTIVALIFG